MRSHEENEDDRRLADRSELFSVAREYERITGYYPDFFIRSGEVDEALLDWMKATTSGSLGPVQWELDLWASDEKSGKREETQEEAEMERAEQLEDLSGFESEELERT